MQYNDARPSVQPVLILRLLLAILPPLALVAFFYRQDRREPEPRGHVAGAFALGLLTVAPALLLAQLAERLLPGLAASTAGDAFVLTGGIEEASKLAVLLASVYGWTEFDEPMDGIVYAVALSLGFATTENALYVLRGGAAVAALRAFFTVPGHALVGAVLGYCVGRARVSRRRLHSAALLAGGFLLAASLHGLFDFILLVTSGWRALSLLSVLSAALWVLALRWMRSAQIRSPFPPAGA